METRIEAVFLIWDVNGLHVVPYDPGVHTRNLYKAVLISRDGETYLLASSDVHWQGVMSVAALVIAFGIDRGWWLQGKGISMEKSVEFIELMRQEGVEIVGGLKVLKTHPRALPVDGVEAASAGSGSNHSGRLNARYIQNGTEDANPLPQDWHEVALHHLMHGAPVDAPTK